MTKRKPISATWLVKRFTIAGLACVSMVALEMPAIAQQAPAAAASDTAELQEIVVTGSMIKRVNAETAEAITILRSDSLKDQGITSVEQALNTLTTNAPSVNIAAGVGSFSGGGTYANLRGLGNGSTLVLLDGQRLAPNAFIGNAVDLSGIPFSAIDNIQVLREGASALYGSDAIAGVINFVTKKNYQGAEVEINFDKPQEAGGGSGEADFSFGHGDLANDGYNFMITGSYHKQQELQATQRAFSAEGFNPAAGVPNTNNPGSWPGSFADANGNVFQSGFPACAGNPVLTTYFGNCAYRYSAATDLLPKSFEGSLMTSITKALPADNQLQLQYFYTQSEVTSYSGPMFYEFQMNPASPYYPKASQLTCIPTQSTNCALPVDLADGGLAIWSDPNNARYNGTLNVAQRVLLTFSGSNAGWDYSTNLNYSKNHNDNRNVSGYPDEALLAPGGVLSTLINPFGPQSAAGQALINSSYVNGAFEIGEDTRWSIDSHASHPLGDAFNSGTPATVAFGASVNGEHFETATTPYNNLVIAATGLTDLAVSGSRTSQALYMELDAPITKGLDIDVSDREDRYSDFGNTNNAKLSVRYQPADFLTFRGAASTGFKAPTLYQLYAPPFLTASNSPTMGSGNPFCTPGNYNAEWTQATCNTQGLGLNGGNKNLGPESSENFDFGVIVSPIQDMGITLDYYRVILKNYIQDIPASAIYANPTGLASSIVTNSSGTLTPSVAEANDCTPYTAPTCGYINQNFQNTGKLVTDGLDISIQYQQHTPIGTFHEDLEGTAVTQFLEQQYSGGPNLNLVGSQQITFTLPAYRWQHNLRVDWTSPESVFGGGLNNRFYSSYQDEYGTLPNNSGPRPTVGSYSLWDAFASYKPTSKMSVLFGVRNLFNTSPPFTNAGQLNFAAGYNALATDPLLRNFYINLKYTFF